MADRVVRVGLATYLRADGLTQFAGYGEKVDVHVDDVERFDRLNGPEPVQVADEDETRPAAPAPARSSRRTAK